MACCARHPVQWAGTTKLGARAARSSRTRGMSGSNTGPLRGKPPITACRGRSPASRRAYRQMLSTPAWPQAGRETTPPCYPVDVSPPGGAAAGDDAHALVLDVDDEGLVVQDQRVRLPAPAEPGL